MPSLLVFLLKSTHFTAPPGIPLSSRSLQPRWHPPLGAQVCSTPHREGGGGGRLRALYAQSFRITLAPLVLPRLLARDWPGLALHTGSMSGVWSSSFTTTIAVITHAIWLDQACAQCPKFLTAAARKRLGRVSVPVWPTILSDRLGISGLVGSYPTNYLIPRKLISSRPGPFLGPLEDPSTKIQTHVLAWATRQILTCYSPVRHDVWTHQTPFDLHVLGLSLAFILSQDQTHVMDLSIISGHEHASGHRGGD